MHVDGKISMILTIGSQNWKAFGLIRCEIMDAGWRVKAKDCPSGARGEADEQ
jgi:hypothetical protein